LGVSIVGVSVDSLAANERFAAKHDLQFPLVSDPSREICRGFGVLKGDEKSSARRSTVVIGRDGMVLLSYDNVRATGHAAQVLADLRRERDEGRI